MFLRIHREGYGIIAGTFGLLLTLDAVAALWAPVLFPLTLLATLVFFSVVVQFFRNPRRLLAEPGVEKVYAPADGKVCAIEEVQESEYFKDKRIQVSIFMSPFNVHVNRNPVSGTIQYFKYHPGQYLVAWHPKSSELNERTTVVYDTGANQVLMRQIAGAVARRIRWYVSEGQQVEQGGEMGFIKFGSRVDLFLPLDAEVLVKLNDKVFGNETLIARLKSTENASPTS